jgi:hypothetical protein
MYWIHCRDCISAHTIIFTSFSISNMILVFLFLPLKQIPSRLEQLQTLYFIYRKSFIKNCIRMFFVIDFHQINLNVEREFVKMLIRRVIDIDRFC